MELTESPEWVPQEFGGKKEKTKIRAHLSSGRMSDSDTNDDLMSL